MNTLEAQQKCKKHLHYCRVKLGQARRELAMANQFVLKGWESDCKEALKHIVEATDAVNELETAWDRRYMRERNERWGV